MASTPGVWASAAVEPGFLRAAERGDGAAGRQDAPVARYDAIALVEENRDRPAPLPYGRRNLVDLSRRMRPSVACIWD
jgi:hypothetical protein